MPLNDHPDAMAEELDSLVLARDRTTLRAAFAPGRRLIHSQNLRPLPIVVGAIIRVMWHRHLEPSDWTLAAVDDVIARGRMDDWKALRDAAASRADVRQRILRVCAPRLSDPRAQRYYFWDHYVRTQLA